MNPIRLSGKRPAKNKFNAKKKTVDGIAFDSKREAKRYLELKHMQTAGLISNLTLQPKFPLYCGSDPVRIRSAGYPNGRHAYYKGDFKYDDADGFSIVEDAKGNDTPLSRLKRAMVEAHYGIIVKLV